MGKTLREQFLEFIKTAPKIEDTSTVINGVEVTWSSKLNAWKIDMTSSVEEFLSKNPDIAAKVKAKYPNLDLKKLSIRDVAGRKKGIRGVGIEALNQLAQATDNPTDATAFIGSGVRAQGTARGSSKADRYIKFGQEQNEGLPKGAQRWTPVDGGVIRKPSRTTGNVKQQLFGIQKKTKDFDSKSLLGKLPAKAEGVRQLGNIVTNNPVTRGIGIGNNARLASIVESATDLAKGIPPGARFGLALLPGLGIVGDTADAAIKHQEAIDDPTLLNKAQDWVAKSVATTSVIPSATAQAYNFVAGVGLGVSDVLEHYGKEISRAIGSPQHPLKGFYKK
jgi:hypothetical protein